jgi:protocatechuate 3,4-dioxygenase beta subunit
MASCKSTTRRDFVIGTLVGVPGAALLPACSEEQTACADNGGSAGTGAGGASGSAGSSDSGSGGSAGSADAGTCTLYPAQTEGPYYLDLNLVRSDITEGKPGTALTVVIEVVRASDCAPLGQVAVDVWHCDAGGVYAGFPGQLGDLDTSCQRFLRGTLLTGGDGKASFGTIYPGWYPGRTTHIHFKVHVTSTTEATSQMYFPEEVTARIYQTGVYAARGQKDTSNASDGANQSNPAPLAAVTESGERFVATLRVTVAG